MTKVITYGSYDLLHYGHLNLLKRAKALGDYLIVGVTGDDYDRRRGKINLEQSLVERIEAVRATGLADEIIVEEYEGQKIDDIKKYGVDIFTVGSDWSGQFDYLKEYCEVVYLPRTEGVSSSEARSVNLTLKLGLVCDFSYVTKFVRESKFINGLEIAGIYTENPSAIPDVERGLITDKDYDSFLDGVDAVYISTHPKLQFKYVSKALNKSKHVLCESPIALSKADCEKLFNLAERNGCILSEAIKTAYSNSYYRLLLLAKIGKIGKIVSVDSTCTNLLDADKLNSLEMERNSIYDWGPIAMLPVFQLLGDEYISKDIVVGYLDKAKSFNAFTNIRFIYRGAVANVKVGKGIKSEGELIISGTEGYIYVPAPWWKTDYFEIRYENPANNKRFFYQLDGEGIRDELIAFVRSIKSKQHISYISKKTSLAIIEVIESFVNDKDIKTIDISNS